MVKYIKILTAFFLLAFFSLYIAMPLYIFTRIASIKTSQQNIIEAKNGNGDYFQKIEISRGQYKKIIYTGIKEFIFNDCLYDIKSIMEENGKYYAYALADKAETTLQKINTHDCNQSEGNSAKILKKFSSVFIYVVDNCAAHSYNAISIKVFSMADIQFPVDIISKIIKPPPDNKLQVAKNDAYLHYSLPLIIPQGCLKTAKINKC